MKSIDLKEGVVYWSRRHCNLWMPPRIQVTWSLALNLINKKIIAKSVYTNFCSTAWKGFEHVTILCVHPSDPFGSCDMLRQGLKCNDWQLRCTCDWDIFALLIDGICNVNHILNCHEVQQWMTSVILSECEHWLDFLHKES